METVVGNMFLSDLDDDDIDNVDVQDTISSPDQRVKVIPQSSQSSKQGKQA